MPYSRLPVASTQLLSQEPLLWRSAPWSPLLTWGTLVTIAIPTLAAGPLLASCLDALNSQIFRDFEVVVINNGNSAVVLPRRPLSFAYSIISPGSNIGFGAAINLAARASSSAYVAALNDDTEPCPAWLLSLVREMEAEPLAGMCASRIEMRRGAAPDTASDPASDTASDPALDSAGMMICFDGSSKQRGHSQPPGSFPRSEEVLLPSGCAALYRRVMLEEIGLFDEDYFLYCEDTDLGLRGRWAGWRCRYVPEAVVYHHYSQTAGAVSVMKARFVERNRLWVALKNFPGPLLLLVPFVSLVRYFWQFSAAQGTRGAAAEFIRSGNSWAGAAGILLRAHWETLLQLPVLLKKRAEIRRKRRLGSFEFARLMYRFHISAKDLARA